MQLQGKNYVGNDTSSLAVDTFYVVNPMVG